MVKELKNTTEFTAAIGDEQTGLVVVDFFAEWCGPCKRIAPMVDELTEKYKNVGFYKVDADNKELQKICNACAIKSLPTFCFFVGGKYIKEMVGANIAGLEKMINENMPKPKVLEEIVIE